jgi:hypothetical protein
MAPLLLLAVSAQAMVPDDEAQGFERTPPRLAFVDGAVSFMRQGAQDWTPAQVNIALASGDALYAAEGSNLEIQIGSRAYVRAGEQTELGLISLEPDFLQLRVTGGTLSLDLRSLKVGHTVERTGYYRIGVSEDVTTFTSRRGGRATVTTASGDSATIAPSEQVVVRDGDAPLVETYAAPELDAWDRWNYARTDDQLDAVSARYVPSDVYGVDDLDQYGDWRVVPTYGAIWVPRAVPAGWAPYSTGRWMYDPYYGWTWVDNAPWGWAPFHYGRWVHVSGYWGWCPGPLVRRTYYAPALVAFYGGGGFSLSVSFGSPQVGWVALGWGEPLVPWWGPKHFREHPHWAGWGGPRYVNNVEIHNTTIIHVNEIHHYRNADVHDAIVEVDRKHFGRNPGDHEPRYRRGHPDSMKPVRDDWKVDPDRSSLVANSTRSERPRSEMERHTVTARRGSQREDASSAPSPHASGREGDHGKSGAAHDAHRPAPGATTTAEATPPGRDADARGHGQQVDSSRRPPFGRDSESVRRIPPPAPRFQNPDRPAPQPPGRRVDPGAAPHDASAAPSERGQETTRGHGRQDRAAAQAASARTPAPPDAAPHPAPPAATQPRREPRDTGSRGSSGRHERTSAPPTDLPGEPANRVYRQPQPPQQASGGGSPRASRTDSQPPAAPAAGPSGRSSGSHSGSASQGRSQRGHRADRGSGASKPDDRNQ